MADEQTPRPLGDEVDPSGADAVEPRGEFLNRPADEVEARIVDDEAEELTAPAVPDATPGKADPEDMVVDDPQQLADAEQVAARARSSRPVRRKPAQPASERSGASAAPKPSENSTEPATRPARPPRPVRRTTQAESEVELAASSQRPSRRDSSVAATSRRTTPGMFVNQSVGELRKVIWPTADQLRQYFVVVLLFVLFIVAYVGLLDAGFGWLMLKLFGKH